MPEEETRTPGKLTRSISQNKERTVCCMYEILDFIHRRWRKDANWLDGNCYWFARILQTRFPFLELYYLPIDGHFVCGDGENFYDWTGVVQLEEIPWLFSDIEEQEPNWYNRIWRDCVL